MATEPRTRSSRTKKAAAGLALGAVAFGGGIVGGAGLGTTIAVAQDAAEEVEERTGWVADALAGLVEDDVITQDQSEAVADALQDARPERAEFRSEHRQGKHHRGGFALKGLDTLTNTLGITNQELAEAVMNGESLADIAEANDVDVQNVIDALTTQADERIDAALESGRIDEDQAEELRTKAADAAEAAVNGSIDDLRGMKRGKGHRFGS